MNINCIESGCLSFTDGLTVWCRTKKKSRSILIGFGEGFKEQDGESGSSHRE